MKEDTGEANGTDPLLVGGWICTWHVISVRRSLPNMGHMFYENDTSVSCGGFSGFLVDVN